MTDPIEPEHALEPIWRNGGEYELRASSITYFEEEMIYSVLFGLIAIFA